MANNFNILYQELIQNLFEYYNSNLLILPGSFKPPLKEHWQAIMQYYNMSEIQQILIFISNISEQKNSNKLLSNTNLLPLFKIIDNYKSSIFKSTFNQIKQNVNTLTYEILRNKINTIISKINQFKTSEYDQLADQLYNYIFSLKKKLFTNIKYTEDNKEITPQISQKILDMYIQSYNVNNKIKIINSNDSSPIISAINFINDKCKNCNIYLGSINNDDLWKEYLKNISFDNNILIKPLNIKINYQYKLQKEYFPEKITNQQFEQIKQLLK